MPVEAGTRYVAPGTRVEVVVTRGGYGSLRCGETPLQARGAAFYGLCVETAGMEIVHLGRRYRDRPSGIEVLVVHPGPCALNVDGRPMELIERTPPSR